MKQRAIGKTSLKSGQIGLGCNRLTDPGNPDQVAVANAAIDRGVVHFDGADSYGNGKTEIFFGKVLKPRRKEITLITKFGVVRNPDGSMGANARPEYAKVACDASLKRLETDVIDLYYLHRMPKDVQIEDTIGAMADLVKAGKAKEIGLSNCTVDHVRRAHKVHPVAAVQMEYSLMERKHEKDLLPVCQELGITFVAFGPMAFSFLAGAIRRPEDVGTDGARARQSRFSSENVTHNIGLLGTVDEIAAELGATASQVALAWTLHRPWDILPIPGSTKLANLASNIAACDLKLTPAHVTRLDEVFSPGRAKGDRSEAKAS
jgi:aryl-alcohol dehydrogenase-like predicted oxidoreductase